jgi:hypothetical protein
MSAIDVMAAVRGRPSGLPGAYTRFANLRAAATLTCLATGLGGSISCRSFTMFKITPNPPETDDVSPYETPDSKKLNEAAERALDYYLKPSDPKPPRKPSTIYTVAPDINIEELLANACESFASAKVIASDCAGFLEGPQRNTILGVAQLIMFGELAVSRALDSLELKADPAL